MTEYFGVAVETRQKQPMRITADTLAACLCDTTGMSLLKSRPDRVRHIRMTVSTVEGTGSHTIESVRVDVDRSVRRDMSAHARKVIESLQLI